MQTETAEPVTEHHPSCKLRCVAECSVSPHHAPREPGPRVRTFHGAPVAQLERYPRPLWEHLDDPEATRRSGCAIPLPETYTAHERVDGRYSLDRWTRLDGVADRELDAAILARDTERKSHGKAARDIGEIAALIRPAFPGITAEPVRLRRSAPVVRRRAPTERQKVLLDLVLGEAPREEPTTPCVSAFEACQPVRDVFTAIVWGLALLLFGREKDPVSEHAFGRMFKGEPVRDMRPPFANATHALAVAARDLPGLGGGSCPWPQEDPRMAQRTWSKGAEMKVSGAFHGTTRIRGETAVHRVFDARAAMRRAALAPHEAAAVAILGERDLTREEKAHALREVEAVRRGIDPRQVVTAETARLLQMARLLGDEAYRFAATERAAVDARARPQLLRALMPDVSDTDLMRAARAVERRVREAVERVTAAGDELAPKRVEKPKPPRPMRASRERIYPTLGAA